MVARLPKADHECGCSSSPAWGVTAARSGDPLTSDLEPARLTPKSLSDATRRHSCSGTSSRQSVGQSSRWSYRREQARKPEENLLGGGDQQRQPGGCHRRRRAGQHPRWRVRGIVSMTTTVFRRYRRLVAFPTLLTLLAFGGTANAEEPDEAGPDTEASAEAEGRRLTTQGGGDSCRLRDAGASPGRRFRAHGTRDVPWSLAGHLWWVALGQSPTSRACSGRKTPAPDWASPRTSGSTAAT